MEQHKEIKSFLCKIRPKVKNIQDCYKCFHQDGKGDGVTRLLCQRTNQKKEEA